MTSLPQLGRNLSLVGTAPPAFATANVVQTIQCEGLPPPADWKVLLDEVLGCSVGHYLSGQIEGAPGRSFAIHP